MFPSLQEFLIFILIILILNFSGVLPIVIKVLKELRGDPTHLHNERKISNDRFDKKYSDLELCFKLLGLSPGASWEEIEKAYIKKARIHHPDRGGDEDTMKAINDAYEILKKVYKVSNRDK